MKRLLLTFFAATLALMGTEATAQQQAQYLQQPQYAQPQYAQPQYAPQPQYAQPQYAPQQQPQYVLPSQPQQGLQENYGAPRFETCTKVISQAAMQGGQCTKVTLSHNCASERYLIMCRHTDEGQNCQISSAPIPPLAAMDFTVCLPTNFLIRHAACRTLEGCDAFAQRRATR